MPGRTWIIAPDAESLRLRWRKLIRAKPEQKEELFHPHLAQAASLATGMFNKVVKGLPGYPDDPTADRRCKRAIVCRRFAMRFRSFDRQWIIPDNRVINQPNPELWRSHWEKQVYLTAPMRSFADRLVRHSPSRR